MATEHDSIFTGEHSTIEPEIFGNVSEANTQSLCTEERPTENDRELLLEAATRLLSYQIGAKITEYYFSLIIFVGLIGNILTLTVMLQKRNRTLTPCIYFIAMAANDMLTVLIGLIRVCTSHLALVLPSELDSAASTLGPAWGCKIGNYLQQTASLAGPWIIVMMTADRLLAIKYALKYKHKSTPRRACYLCILAWFIAALYVSPHLYTARITYHGSSYYMCYSYYVEGDTNVYFEIYFWTNTLLNSVVPFIFLFTMNLFIIQGLKSQGKVFPSNESPGSKKVTAGNNTSREIIGHGNCDIELKNMKTENNKHCKKEGHQKRSVRKNDNNEENKNIQRQNREKQATKMLLLSSFVMLALSIPKFIRFVFYLNRNIYESPQVFADYTLAQHITTKLDRTNCAVDFLLYCLAGSKFRKDVWEMLTGCRRRIERKLC